MRKYKVIYADPPWAFVAYTRTTVPHRRMYAKPPYGVMSMDELKALPIAAVADDDCALLMWIVDSHIDQGFALAEAWGFKFKTKLFTWLKVGKNGKPRMGMGHWTRKETEQVYLFTRGRPKRLSGGVRETITAQRREHSRKPDEAYERIEVLLDGPYLELFARHGRKHWARWGNEAGGSQGIGRVVRLPRLAACQ